ncbi:MAG: glycerophosphodiester phosphodiesterase [Deltaproteobacteria bacterium]|nr:glycerophosphodiester phosphodiesterase [Deltaproteobacteria bacterium]MBW2421774.1 glycerophosphodiester phosphodiesterase [Deltaproteobacteria bacterium]
MNVRQLYLGVATALTLAAGGCGEPGSRTDTTGSARAHGSKMQVQLGPRPFYLVESMEESELKSALQACSEGPFRSSEFVIGHRGAPLQFPEHTRESYLAAARMGAGILECDVTFTRDQQLVCRHAQCDLHATTNILAIPELAARCSEPFSPADPQRHRPASARCCASDITLAEFKTLCGKMDAFDPDATSVEEYMKGTPRWRTDLYASCGTLLSHAESIELFSSLGVGFAPELKQPEVEMPFRGDYTRESYAREPYTQERYAQHLIDEYEEAGIDPGRVWAQSFFLADLLYWIEEAPRFGEQAVLLDDRVFRDASFRPTLANMQELRDQGVRIVAPPLWALVDLDHRNEIVPSRYAALARRAGLDIIAWSLERYGPVADGDGWYYQSVREAVDRDGDMLELLDVLAKDVGIRAIFSDWPATATYYASCMGLE